MLVLHPVKGIFMSHSDIPVRVRFAPSPTGYLHVGGARTAIYNYFFAKALQGTFYLRIEDTDQKRYNEEALQDLLKDLQWLGLNWDEGPGVNEKHGPYFQSQRLHLYAQHIQKLLDSGDAYYCFCTEERLQELRAEQEKSGASITGYDRHCRDISKEEAKNRIAQGEKAVIRFKVPKTGNTTFTDFIRGEISYQNELQDDLVLIKRDGFPTYHFASVVDDHLMQTSHVLRGDEWISSTPKHILLYKAFGWEPPVFCHLPVILAAGGGKLSKRKGAASVGDFRELGYLPEALVNFLALLGWNPGDEREVMSLEEMINSFSLDRINPKSVAFDEKKLKWMNGQHLHRCDHSVLLEALLDGLKKESIQTEDFNKEYHLKVVEMLKTRVSFLTDLAPMASYFYKKPSHFDEKAQKKNWGENSLSISKSVRNELEKLTDFNAVSIEKAFQQLAESSQIGLGKIVGVVRLAVSGVAGGPGLWEMFELLGQSEVLNRIENAESLMKS